MRVWGNSVLQLFADILVAPLFRIGFDKTGRLK